jgi:hypothetical protein
MYKICGKNVNKLLKSLWGKCVEFVSFVYKNLVRFLVCAQFGIIRRNIQKFYLELCTRKNEVFYLLRLDYPRFPHRTTTITTIYNVFFLKMRFNYKKEVLWK